jgi:hypothetical protein
MIVETPCEETTHRDRTMADGRFPQERAAHQQPVRDKHQDDESDIHV